MGIPRVPSPQLHRRADFFIGSFGSQTRKHGCNPAARRWKGVISELGAAKGDQLVVIGRRPSCGKNEAPAAPKAKGERPEGQGLKGPRVQETSPGGKRQRRKPTSLPRLTRCHPYRMAERQLPGSPYQEPPSSSLFSGSPPLTQALPSLGAPR